jgi:GNAT superfamily N-acetyltransferase
LDKAEAAGVVDNFLCNFELTLRAHREHRLIVYVDDPGTGIAVAYQWGGLTQPGILEVRHDMRGRGIGRQLIEHRIAQARRKDEGLLYIQCKPESSIPFWRAMGFTLLEPSDRGRNYAYRVLDKAHVLPPRGQAVDVTIRAYPEEAKWEPDTKPLFTASPLAMAYRDGTIRLVERVYIFERLYPSARDIVVEITVGGRVRYRDKVRCEDAERFGVRRCSNGFFIDRILSPRKHST